MDAEYEVDEFGRAIDRRSRRERSPSPPARERERRRERERSGSPGEGRRRRRSRSRERSRSRDRDERRRRDRSRERDRAPPPPSSYDSRRGPPQGGPQGAGVPPHFYGGGPPPGRGGPYGGPPPPHVEWMGRGGPGMRGGPGPRGGVPGGPNGGIMTFKQFMATLPDDTPPAEAQQRYEAYEQQYHETHRQEYWQAHKDDPKMRAKFDPRQLEETLLPIRERVVELAAAASAAFAEALDAGEVKTGEPAAGSEEPEAAEDEDAATEAKLADADADMDDDAAEKPPAESAPVEAVKLPPPPPLAWTERQCSMDTASAETLIRKLDAEKGITVNPLPLAPTKQDDAGAAEADAGDAAEEKGAGDAGDAAEEKAAAVASDAPVMGALASAEALAALDERLSYLWSVHAVDYYGMLEATPEEFEAFAEKRKRTVRGKKPPALDGVEALPAELVKGARPWAKRLNACWKRRLNKPDLFEQQLGKARVEKEVEAFVEKAVVVQGEDRFACLHCVKAFRAPEYVTKHVRNKHANLVENVVESVLDKVYLENYLRDAEEQAAKRRREGGMGGRGGGRGGPMMGRGRGRGGPMVIPMMGPGGVAMVPAPGAGPLGPFVPVSPAMAAPMMGGFMPGMGRARPYTDLDAPTQPQAQQQDRAVLDYGDL